MKKKKIFKRLCTIILYIIVLFVTQASYVFATDEPLTVINNLSDFVFGLIRAVRNDYFGVWSSTSWYVAEIT